MGIIFKLEINKLGDLNVNGLILTFNDPVRWTKQAATPQSFLLNHMCVHINIHV